MRWRLLLYVPIFSAETALSNRRLRGHLDYNSVEGLHTFVSRPDLTPPKFEIHTGDRSQISPGYWFIAPYADLRDRPASSAFQPGQIGPHIYDASGNLVWSGAQLFGNRATFDFKTATCDGSPCLTFILDKDLARSEHQRGVGVIADESFQIQEVLGQTAGNRFMNMHEFTVTEYRSALMIVYKAKFHDAVRQEGEPRPYDRPPVRGWLGDGGFQEIDVTTKEPKFEWWALDHISPSETFAGWPDISATNELVTTEEKPWDVLHLNSVDRDTNGDYLISSRHLNSIYKISGEDGSIIWQLGGVKSSFLLKDFSFSSQHDARFYHQNKTHSTISLFNNAADGFPASGHVSSAMFINLDHTTMTATLLRKWDRPDRQLSHLRGNVQSLPNGNSFVCWSDQGHITEFNAQGDLVLDAKFASRRFVTYRAYKFNFTAAPLDSPAIKAFVYGSEMSSKSSVTVIYVSWNGATEISSWRFYGSGQLAVNSFELLGETDKAGFETVFTVSGINCEVYAEAVGSNGDVLGSSETELTSFPGRERSSMCASLVAYDELIGLPEEAFSDEGKVSSEIPGLESSPSVHKRLLLIGVFVGAFLLTFATYKIRRLRSRVGKYRYKRLDKVAA